MSSLQKKLIILGISVSILSIAGGLIYWFQYAHTDNRVTYEKKENSIENQSTQSGIIAIAPSWEVWFISEIIWAGTIIENDKKTPLSVNKKLLAGSTIVTEEDTVVSMILNDNSILRLWEKSTLIFSDSNTVRLESGDVWARIIRPLMDDSLFSIETSDSSAWIRWTAVLVEKKTNRTLTTVVDSSIQKDAVTLTTEINGIKEEERLSPDEVVEVSKQWKKKQKKSTKDILDSNDSIADFLKQDILYLVTLEEKISQDSDEKKKERVWILLTKIQKEIEVSLPQEDELENFFHSSSTRDTFLFLKWSKVPDTTQSGALRELTQKEQRELLLEIMTGDLELSEEKKALKRLRNTSTEGNTREEKTQEINNLEEKIRKKESKWWEDYLESFKRKFDPKNEIISDNSSITPDSQKKVETSNSIPTSSKELVNTNEKTIVNPSANQNKPITPTQTVPPQKTPVSGSAKPTEKPPTQRLLPKVTSGTAQINK
jgi:hypothetical protein